MGHMKFAARVMMLFLLIYAAFPRNAYAYLDPGTGSFMLQVIVGFLVGAIFAIKMFWANIRGFLSELFSGKGKRDREERK
jgi:hypothetical protein